MDVKKHLIFVTGGHATPAIACISELKKRGFNNILYIGQKKTILFDKNLSPEYQLVKEKMGVEFRSIIAGKLSVFWNLHSILWFLRLPVGFIHAFFLQLYYRPATILTFGSYVGLPVVFWGWVFQTPVIVHEQTVTLGRANRVIQRFATKVCYSWQHIIDDGDKAKTKDIKWKVENTRFIYTGNPIRKEILNSHTNTFEFAQKKRKTIFITGGNQGAHALNTFFLEKMRSITQRYNVIHQTGSNSVFNDFNKAENLATELNKDGVVYIPKPYVFVEEMAESYAKSFVIIGRAGANTITELLALQRKAILIPIPTTAGNEQFLNAEFLRKLGMAIIISQSDLDQMDILKVLEEAENLKIKDKETVSLLASMHKEAEVRIIDILEGKLRKLLT